MPPADASSGVVVVLTPVGRDAKASAGLIEQVGLQAAICPNLESLAARLNDDVSVVLLAEEALYGKPVELLAAWVRSQPPWSDQPFVILTNHNEGPKFAAFRRELVGKLRNVSFLERPLQ